MLSFDNVPPRPTRSIVKRQPRNESHVRIPKEIRGLRIILLEIYFYIFKVP